MLPLLLHWEAAVSFKNCIIYIVLILTIVAGCSSGGSAPPAADASDLPREEEDARNGDVSSISESAVNKMIVKNAYLEIEADSSAALYSNIAVRAKQLGGYESSYDISNYESFTVVNAEVRIPSENFDEFVSFINESSRVINSNMNSADITEEYYDVKTRLETKRATIEKYYRLLESASSVDEIIQLQKTIDEITMDIESMEGKLKLWNSQVSMSTVTMLIRQINDPIKIKKDINWSALSIQDMGYLIVRGFATTLNYVLLAAQWILIALFSLSPVAFFVALVYFGLKKFRQKFSLKNKDKHKSDAGETGDKKDR